MVFSTLNRRRIDLRPLQKRDILDELKTIRNPDVALIILEQIDSYWLGEQFKKIRRKNNGH